MKTLIFFLLGVFFGILTLDFAMAAIISLVCLSIAGLALNGILAVVFAMLTIFCFGKI